MNVDLTLTDARAIEIALDELIAYTDVIGDDDEAHARQVWACERLRSLLARAGYAVPKHIDGDRRGHL